MQPTVVVSPSLDARPDSALLARAATTTLEASGYELEGEVTIMVTTDEELRRLNRRYRRIDETTDVLSFAFEEGQDAPNLPRDEEVAIPLGDVVISYPRAKEQAETLGHPLAQELAWLVVHGTLQLIGFHHDSPEDAEKMSAMESRILANLGMSEVIPTIARLERHSDSGASTV